MELLLDPNKRYTYADYLTWQDDKRRELIDGFIREKSTPGTVHQEISRNLVFELYQIIEASKRQCEIFFVLDIRLPKNGETEYNQIYTVVQPDICIICDPSKLDEMGGIGAPDFIAEILSPSTTRYDIIEKFDVYEAAGVREYWVVFPDEAVQVFILQPDGKYDKGKVYEDGKVPVHIFDGIEIELKDIFKDLFERYI